MYTNNEIKYSTQLTYTLYILRIVFIILFLLRSKRIAVNFDRMLCLLVFSVCRYIYMYVLYYFVSNVTV